MESPLDYRPRGLPRWTLWASVPVVLALGFVAGMAIATYVPAVSAQPAPPVNQQATGQVTPPPAVPTTESTDSGWRIVTAGQSAANRDQSAFTPGSPLEANAPPVVAAPAAPRFTGKATNLLEAKRALSSDFAAYQSAGVAFQVEYQPMRQAARGTSLVGLIAVSDYPAWERALREQPAELKKWLTDAAARVQDASTSDRFHIAWAIVDVVREKPVGFADAEITPLDPNRAFLVIRPLASTVDHTKTEISLRPLASLLAAGTKPQAGATDPWAAYGPIIRFDADDLYRPVRTIGQQPILKAAP